MAEAAVVAFSSCRPPCSFLIVPAGIRPLAALLLQPLPLLHVQPLALAIFPILPVPVTPRQEIPPTRPKSQLYLHSKTVLSTVKLRPAKLDKVKNLHTGVSS